MSFKKLKLFVTVFLTVISVCLATVVMQATEQTESGIVLEFDKNTLNKVASTLYTDADGDYYIASVNLNVAENAGFLCLKGELTYPQQIILLGTSDGDLCSKGFSNISPTTAADLAQNPYKVALVAATSADDIRDTGTLITFNFRVPADTELGDYPLSFVVTEVSNSAYEIITERVSAPLNNTFKVTGSGIIYKGNTAFTVHSAGDNAFTPAASYDPAYVRVDKESVSTRIGLNPAADASEYPIMKVYYRTNMTEADGSLSKMQSMTISLSQNDTERDRVEAVGASSSFPQTADTWGSAIYDLSQSALGFYKSYPIYGIAPVESFSLDNISGTGEYFDIGYVAFFKTVEEAEAATFEPIYTVTFISNGEVYTTKAVWESGALLKYPEVNPTKDGAVFASWSIEENTPVTSNMTVYANYTEAPVYYGKALINPQSAYGIYYYVTPRGAQGSDPRLYHMTGNYVSSSTAASNLPTVQFTGSNTVDVKNFPIVKIYYRTDVMDASGTKAATPTIVATASNWNQFSLIPLASSNLASETGKWGYIIANLNRTNLFTDTVKLRELSASKFLTEGSDNYLDISYIGFFPDTKSALAATYEPEYTVTFESNGEYFAKQDIWESGVKLVYPEVEPVEENLIFTGWNIAEGTSVVSDITVSAQYVDSIIYTANTLLDPKTAYGESHYTSPTAATDTTPRLYHITPSSGLASYGEMRFTGAYAIYPHRTPYIKIYYKTDLALDPVFKHTSSDWMIEQKEATVIERGDAEHVGDSWKYAIIDISNARYSKDVSCRGISVSGNFESGSTNYIDIAYIGLFTTLDAARRETLEPLCTVTFVYEDEVYATQSVWKNNASLVLPATEPTKFGERFKGWTDHYGNAVTAGTKIDYDVNYYALFEKPIYAGDTLIDPKTAYGESQYTRPTAATSTAPRLLKIKYQLFQSSYADIRFTGQYAVKAHETPIVKIYYRTNMTTTPVFTHTASDWSFEKKTATVLDSSKIPSTGNWGYVILDISHANYSDSVYCRSIDLSSNFKIFSSNYIDIAYIGFFINEEEAMAAKYPVIEPDVNVKFMLDGEVYSTSTVKYGSALVYPKTAPIKDGYRFAGWTMAEGSAVLDDIVLTAQFVKQITITFEADGVQYGETLTVDAGTLLEYPETNPVKEGYRFDGWDIDEETAIEENTTVKAKFVKLITITFEADGVQYGEALTVDAGTLLEYPETNPVKEGYRFDGWDIDEETAIEENTTVKAKFTKLITITFEADGVQYGETLTVDAGTLLEYPETNPEVKGKVFKGWSIPESTVIEEDTVVTANFVIVGDVTGDNKVTAKDTVFLARYIAKWPEYSADNINIDGADVNNSKTVTALDTVVLARHIAKWPGYETLPYGK